MVLSNIRLRIYEYAKNKNWYLYLPVWFFGVYLFINVLRFELSGEPVSFFVSIAQSLNFFLHEMAHLFAGFLPSILTAAAGSFSEILLGLGLIIGAFATRCYFASIFCFLWFMLACQSTADYMADAKLQQLPLVSFGGSDPIHDWNYVFTKLGLLEQSSLIAGVVRSIGILSGLFALAFCAWLIYLMAAEKSKAAHTARMNEIMNRKVSLSPDEREDEPFVSGGLYPEAKVGPLRERQDTAKSSTDPKPPESKL